LVEEVRRIVQAGGKKIRPAFSYAAYVASGGRSHGAILYAASALELWHAFALIHDDIIDDSALRRGQPTAHKAFERFYQNRGFPGDPQKFGISAAILAGDLASSFADELLDTAPFPAERIRRAKIYYNAMKQQTIYGEHLDTISHVKKQTSERDVLKITEYKTAKYTVERPLHIGATLAGAEEETLQVFSRYAVPFGQAFQIQDDILGTFGKEEDIGKPTDSDIKEGKMTLLAVKAYEFAKVAEGKILDGVLGNRKASSEEIESVRDVFKRTGSVEYSRNLANRLFYQAKREIGGEKLDEEGKNFLLQAADYFLSRSL
jgi:geranylgeranyl diphosphate synthase type I